MLNSGAVFSSVVTSSVCTAEVRVPSVRQRYSVCFVPLLRPENSGKSSVFFVTVIEPERRLPVREPAPARSCTAVGAVAPLGKRA